MDLNVFQRISNTGCKFFAAIAGGGQTFIGDYTSISGASKTFLGGYVPYAQPLFLQFIKQAKLDSHASEEAARKLAVASFNKCLEAGAYAIEAIGIGAANSIVKDGERVGREHRFFIATHSATQSRVLKVILQQGRTRQQEEAMCSLFIFKMLQWQALNEPTNFQSLILPNETWEVLEDGDIEYAMLTSGVVEYLPNFKVTPKLAVFCGSWNPYHEGHEGIYKLANQILGVEPILELSVHNTDKGQLDFIDLGRRVTSIGEKPYMLTRAATFIEKARLLRTKFHTNEIVFVVGLDTWQRIWDAKYAGDPEYVERTLKAFDVKFLVFGRGGAPVKTGFGESLRIKDARAEAYSSNLSSTAIRNNKV